MVAKEENRWDGHVASDSLARCGCVGVCVCVGVCGWVHVWYIDRVMIWGQNAKFNKGKIQYLK